METTVGGRLIKQWSSHFVNDTALLEGVVGRPRQGIPALRGVFRYRTVYGVQLPIRENYAET
jgi:hypothetical protein